MKYSINIAVFLLISLVSLFTWGKSTPADQSQLSQDSIYQVTGDSVITPMAIMQSSKVSKNKEATPYFLMEGETFVVNFYYDFVRIHFLLDEEEMNDFPTSVAVSHEDFKKMNIEFLMSGDIEKLSSYLGDQEPVLENARYSSGNHYRRKSRARMHYKGAKGCVAYVLSRIGWPGGRSGNGVDITRTLKAKMGYHAVSCSHPQPGTIASWSGGSGAGHTAIWNGRCWAYDIACADPGRRYRLRECVAR